jgi:glycosyltransferase involved in cell wall biosynthesis
MPEIAFAPGSLFFILFILLALAFVIQQFYYWFFFIRVGIYRDETIAGQEKGVSVVICARDEYHHLKENLPFMLEQDYPDFEVVVVNHASDDDSAFLLTHLADRYPHLKVVEIRENLNFFSGKKFPLSIGIKSARNELILLTDADCRPAGNQWIRHMQSTFKGPIEIVLGYGPYQKKKGLLNKLIRFDTAQIAIQYLSFALAGIPYMGVGRNMGYLKTLFYRNKGFISHYKISSGDDDLFINRVADRSNTRVIMHPESFTISEPHTAFRYWMLQKKRHLSTSRFYRSRHKFLLGAYNLVQFLFYGLFIFLLASNYNILVVLTFFILKSAVQLYVFGKAFSKLKEKDLVWLIPFYEIVLLLINLWMSIMTLFSRSPRWK